MGNDDIQRLFRQCMQLRQVLRRLETLAARVQEIAMNGSVAAGQTGHQAKVYSEIAHQIGIAGRRMRLLTDACRTEVDGLASLTLKALVVQRHHGKYAEARPHIRGEGNRARLAAVMAASRGSIGALMRGMPRHVLPVDAALRNLGATQDRLFSTVTTLRVEAVDLSGSQAAAIGGLGDRLGAVIEEWAAGMQDLAALLRLVRDESRRIARHAQSEGRGDAQIRAA